MQQDCSTRHVFGLKVFHFRLNSLSQLVLVMQKLLNCGIIVLCGSLDVFTSMTKTCTVPLQFMKHVAVYFLINIRFYCWVMQVR